MEELSLKLLKVLDLIKAIKSTIGPTIPSLPAVKQPAPPSITPRVTETKIPGISPNSNKDPKKIAQQIKDGSMSTKTQRIMLKANGQWYLDYADETPASI